MPRIDIVRSSPVTRTARVMQAEGIFDVPPSQRSEERWSVNLELPDAWNIGVIVGPSGAGKSTVARELFGAHLVSGWEWPTDKSVLDGFSAEMSIKEIVELLSSVGFSSPPSWVRPFHVLSNGEQFRVTMARTLAEMRDLAVVDEFTSVVDRTVAQIGSAAIAKTVRRRNQRLIVVTCHYDVLEWLEPDWIYQPHTGEFSSGRYLQRPKIELQIKRVHYSAWKLFKKHHYMSADLNLNTNCFVAFWNDTPVAFLAWSHFPHATRRPTKRISRIVVLPDYQGVGIGQALNDTLGSVVAGLGYSGIITTSHPAVIQSMARARNWRMTKGAAMNASGSVHSRAVKKIKSSFGRLTAAFEYVGAAMPADEARRVWNG